MKQLRNIVAPIFLLCLMLVAGLPVFAQTQEDVTPQEQKENMDLATDRISMFIDKSKEKA